MKNTHPSATSLPRAPREGADSRTRTYLITMGIRVLCFALMVLVTPYGWWTWVFGAGAIFLPYIAVVFANVASDVSDATIESPERALTAAPVADDVGDASPAEPAEAPRIIRVEESREDRDA